MYVVVADVVVVVVLVDVVVEDVSRLTLWHQMALSVSVSMADADKAMTTTT